MHFVHGQLHYMVEVIYSPLNAPMIHMHLDVPEHATVGEVLHLSGLWDTHPEIRDLSVGIFSKAVELTTVVKAGDRVEIYRPLLLDPMEKRRRRAKGH